MKPHMTDTGARVIRSGSRWSSVFTVGTWCSRRVPTGDSTILRRAVRCPDCIAVLNFPKLEDYP